MSNIELIIIGFMFLLATVLILITVYVLLNEKPIYNKNQKIINDLNNQLDDKTELLKQLKKEIEFLSNEVDQLPNNLFYNPRHQMSYRNMEETNLEPKQTTNNDCSGLASKS